MYGHRCTPMSHLFGRWGEEGKEREVPEDLILFAGQIKGFYDGLRGILLK